MAGPAQSPYSSQPSPKAVPKEMGIATCNVVSKAVESFGRNTTYTIVGKKPDIATNLLLAETSQDTIHLRG